MKGIVDGARRALIEVQVRPGQQQPFVPLGAWIDTAFNGSLVVPRDDIERLGLRATSTTEAILADGATIELETFECNLEWFGSLYRIQVIASDSRLPLLGTSLLAGHRLMVDYGSGEVTLD